VRYLCIGYLDPKAMDALPKSGLNAIMGECGPHMAALDETGQVLIEVRPVHDFACAIFKA